MADYLATLNFALRSFDPLTGFSHALQRQQFSAVACWKKTGYHFGEFDRYSKDHQNPISIDRVPVQIPTTIKEAKFTEYRHARLVGESDEIRLLELLPTVWSKSHDFVACRLVVKQLSENPQYEALSYTWGTLARDVPIFVVPNPLPDGLVVSEALPMTPQLYVALKRLRLEKASRYLWVDQISIDQTSNREKGKQVMLMDKIYEQSKRTIIWLGEEDEHCAPFEEMIGFLIGGESSIEADTETVKKLLAVDHGAGKRRQEAVTHMLNRDWFTRAWVFQEAVLSKELIVRCGGLEVPFDKLKRLIDAVMRVQYDSGGYARSLLKTTVGFDTVDLIKHEREPCSDQQCQRLTDTNLLGVLFDALQQFRATNPRDLIYAFLAPRFQNLRPENRITPDYDKDVQWIWTDAARRIIADMQSLDILAAARGGEQEDFELPSWVPDWSYCFRFARPIVAPDFKTTFDASHGRLHIVDISPADFFSLRVTGKIIRKIAWISPRNFEISYYRDGMGEFLDLGNHVASLKQHLGFQRGLSAEEIAQRWQDLRGEVLRTILADGAFGHEQPLPVKTKELERILTAEKEIMEMKQRLDAGEHMPNPLRWRDDHQLLGKLWGWALVAQKKVMFNTKTADVVDEPATINLGLAARAVRVNDVIVVLHGSKVPIVLRPAEGGQNRWHVISQCYLEGWMYSTAEDLDWEEDATDSFTLV